jgi:two-component system, sensor histidine kinase
LRAGEWAIEAGIIYIALAIVAVLGCLQVASFFHGVARSLRQSRHAAELASEEAQAGNRAKSQFFAVMSHELRTPMNAMLGSAELLRRTDLSREQRGHVEALLDGGAMLMALLNDVLDMSKLEAGAMRTENIPVDVARLVNGLGRLWQARAADKNLHLVIEVAPGVPGHVLTDPTRLRQVLFNLMSNAVKFTSRGEVRLSVQVEGMDATGQARIIYEVRDTGVGIPGDIAARLFRPFEQADSSTARKHGGTGLGLSICRGLTEAMGGTISLVSAPGEGACFRVSLPLLAADAPEPEEEAAGDATADIGRVQILVADDNAANRRLIGALLQPMGAEVIIACDGREAVDLFCVDTFDIVLMDVQMPEMDGLEATRAIRKLSELGARVPIVAITANATDEDRRKCLEAGMDDVVVKPIDPRALHAVIYSQLSRAASEADGLRTAA